MDLFTLREFHRNHSFLIQNSPSQWETKVCIVLLQLVTAFKHLQATGVEEISIDYILISEVKNNNLDESLHNLKPPHDPHPRVIVVPPHHTASLVLSGNRTNGNNNPIKSFCHCASDVTYMLLQEGQINGKRKLDIKKWSKAFQALIKSLEEDRSGSLTKVRFYFCHIWIILTLNYNKL